MDPPQSDGIHPEEGLNSRHRRKLFAHILHPPSPRTAPTPAPLCLFCSRAPLHWLSLIRTPMGGDSSSSWWEGWSGTYHGWHDSSSSDPTPTVQATDEQVINAVHRLRDRLKLMTDMTKRRSHKTGTERATSTFKGNAANAAMEAVIMAHEWHDEAKRAYDQKFVEAAEVEETYHDAIRRTLEKTEALERHVKTVTMRADSLVTTEADFFQTLIASQEETIRELNTLYGQLCLPRSTS